MTKIKTKTKILRRQILVKDEYKTGEAAHLLGVSADVLRGWERDELIPQVRRAANNYRVWTQADIDAVAARVAAGPTCSWLIWTCTTTATDPCDGCNHSLGCPFAVSETAADGQ